MVIQNSRQEAEETSLGPIGLVRPVLPTLEAMEPELRSILASGMVTKGRFLEQFEGAIAAHLGVKHAIGVSSCTTGLMLTYRCLDLGGEVLVPSFTFMATVSALVWAGARPVFVDVEEETANLDPAAVEAAITPHTRAIVAAHIFGNPANIDVLQEIAARYGLTLIFDAAHGFGAQYRGRPVGPGGAAQVFSMSPTKLLISGEGGIVATDDDALANRLRMGREYGNDGTYNSAFAGMNARLGEMNAVMGLKSLELLEAAAVRRNELVSLYRSRLEHLPGVGFQAVRPGDRNSYKDFSITIDAGVASRDRVAQHLRASGIDSRTYYDPPLHRHTAYNVFYSGQPLPRTERLAAESLSLPLWSRMDDAVVHRICDELSRALS